MARERGVMLFDVGNGGLNDYGNPLPAGIVNWKIGNANGFTNIGTQTYFTGSEKIKIYSDKIIIPTGFYKRHTYVLARNELREWRVFSIVKPENVTESGKRNANLLGLVLSENVNTDLLDMAVNFYNTKVGGG